MQQQRVGSDVGENDGSVVRDGLGGLREVPLRFMRRHVAQVERRILQRLDKRGSAPR